MIILIIGPYTAVNNAYYLEANENNVICCLLEPVDYAAEQ